MKKLLLAASLMFLSACSSVDKHVKLLGEYNDHFEETRYEVYIRAVDIDEPSRLKHRDEPSSWSESEVKSFVFKLQYAEKEGYIIETQVKKDIDAGRGHHLPKEQPQGK